MNAVKQNIKNSVFNVADVILYPFLFFLSIPFFIKHLGSESFGLWMLMNTILITSQVLNIGLPPSLVRYLSLYRSQNKLQDVGKTVGTGISVSLVFMLAGIFSGIIISFCILKINLFNLPRHLVHTAFYAMLVTSFTIGLKFIEQALLYIFRGLERYDLYFFMNNSIKIVILLINMFQVVHLKSVTGLLVTNLIITILMLCVQLLIIKKTVPPFRCFQKDNLLHARELFRFGLYNWLQSLIIIIVFQLDRFLVVTAFGPLILGHYILISTIYLNIHVVFTATSTWLIPRIVEKTLSDKADKNHSLFYNLRAFVTISGIMSLSLFYILYEPLFTLWIGVENLVQLSGFINLFTQFEFFYLLLIVPPLYMNYSGNQGNGTFIIFFVSLLNIAGILIGYKLLNSPEGIVFGLIISTIVSIPVIYYKTAKALQLKNRLRDIFFFLLLPSIASLLVFCETLVLQLAVFSLLITLCWAYFIKFEKNNIRILFH